MVVKAVFAVFVALLKELAVAEPQCDVGIGTSGTVLMQLGSQQTKLGKKSELDTYKDLQPQELESHVVHLVQNYMGTSRNGSTSDGGKEPFAEIKSMVEKYMITELVADAKENQDELEASYNSMINCVLNVSSEDEVTYHHEHNDCRKLEADIFEKNKTACETLHDLAVNMDQIPCPNIADKGAVQGWRSYFDVMAPIFEDKYQKFKKLDDECQDASTKLVQQRTTCNQKQAAYEGASCAAVGSRRDGAVDCLKKNADNYDATTVRLKSLEKKRALSYTAMKRTLCYIDAVLQHQDDLDATQSALHDCHKLEVILKDVMVTYYNKPPLALKMEKFYPCGRDWLHFAYARLPAGGPPNRCSRCKDLPNLDGSADTFIRWGGASCPSKSDLVYTGYTAGSYYAHSGSGANYLCLTNQPAAAPDTNNGDHNQGRLWGVEYENMYVGKNTNNQEVACSTCAYSGATYVHWGSAACPSGEDLLYRGNVMANHHSHKKTEWICVDEAREKHNMSNDGNNDQGLLYIAEYETGSLPSSAFTANKEVGCAVCGIPDSKSAVYSRWGHDECGDDAVLVYTGVAASSSHGSHGGGHNNICLDLQPTDAPDTNTADNNQARLYGTEYEGMYVGKGVHDKDAACSVCRYKGKSTYVSWGTNICATGHTTLYKGNVAADHTGHQRQEYVCVDDERKAHKHSSTSNHNGNLWYLAEYETGSLSSSTYTANYEVECAVCGVPEHGAVFTRWGHTSCPAFSSTVYSGQVAGSFYGHTGGGANSICLTANPTYASHLRSGNHDHASLYGTEYESIYVGKNHNDKDAACAVCAYEGQAAYTTWGRPGCSTGHKLLYSGNVMSGHYGHQKFNYACVDTERAYVAGGGNHNGALWYLVEAESGSLPSSKYSGNQEVGCAVCGIGEISSQTGRNTCNTKTSVDSCVSEANCIWHEGACRASCVTYSTVQKCTADYCEWDGHVCMEACKNFNSELVCPASHCVWKGTCENLQPNNATAGQ